MWYISTAVLHVYKHSYNFDAIDVVSIYKNKYMY